MARGPVKSPQQAAQNWKAAMSAPTTAAKYTQGVQNVQQSPTAAAASPQAQAKYAAKTQEAVSSGRMAAALNSVSTDQWKQAAVKGASRLSTGAANNADKQARAAQRLHSAWQNARDAAEAIPHDGSEEAAVARFTASMRAMKQAKGAR